MDEYFMSIAFLAWIRSNCMKRAVGCVITKSSRILSIGYNGTPIGTKNCFLGGCKRCNSNTG
jgi:dCMP deaminase